MSADRQQERTTRAVSDNRPGLVHWRAGLVAACLGLCAAAAQAGEFEIGSGIFDITGPVAEIGMFGYAAQQEVDGLHQRMRSHAYVIKDPASSRRVVFVSADLGAMFQSVKLEVVRELQKKYGNLYSASNVMLTATHTHVGVGMLSHYPLYILATADKSGFGYDDQSYWAVVNGIVKSIERAHNNLAPGSIELVQGDLLGANRNRSLDAYRNNSDHANYAYDTNKKMTLLKLRKDNGREIGLIDWFSVHPTSFSMKFTKVSADNKGYAQMRFEKLKGTDHAAGETFVAAFANSDEGDSVPTDGNAYSAPGYQGSANEYANAEAAGRRQFDRALQLYNSSGTRLTGSLDYRHQWVNHANFTVTPEFSGNGYRTLCSASRGFSFAAGGENGPSNIPGIYEGMTKDNFDFAYAASQFNQSPLAGGILFLFGTINLFVDDSCQWHKPNLLPTGGLDWVPEVLPFQIFTVGQLAIVALPYETTTMAGRRVRDRVQSVLAARGITHVVIAGLANTYSGYLTTNAEFQAQHYEGASTEFGPYALAATEQILTGLSRALVDGTAVADTGTPPYKTNELRLQRPDVVFDDKWLWESFGQVMTDAKPSYARGGEVTVTFRGGHPKNNLRTQDTFLKVERLVDGQWITVANDWDWDTTYRWRRDGIARSFVDVTWRIPADAAPGHYRIRQFGDWKNGWDGVVRSYTGTSSTFAVN